MEENKIKLDLPEMVELVGFGLNRAVYLDGTYLNPESSQKLLNHSPDGYNWGYNGSGPAQLALAVTEHFLEDDIALLLHQSFKDKFIAPLAEGNFRVRIKFLEWYKYMCSETQNPEDSAPDSDFIEIMPFELPETEAKAIPIIKAPSQN